MLISGSNKIDLRTVNTLEGNQILDCNSVFLQEIQNVIKTIGTDFYGLARFAQSCSQKVSEKNDLLRESELIENTNLPPCSEDNTIDDYLGIVRNSKNILYYKVPAAWVLPRCANVHNCVGFDMGV